MKKYIDYNILEQEAYEMVCHARKQVDLIIANTIKSMIDKQPDALVRCKDCKHREYIYSTKSYQCSKVKKTVDDEWFCADGKRRDGNG